MLVGSVQGSELPALAEDVQPDSGPSQTRQIGRRSPERAFELPANQSEDGVEDRFPNRVRQRGLGLLEVPAARDEQAPPPRGRPIGLAQTSGTVLIGRRVRRRVD